MSSVKPVRVARKVGDCLLQLWIGELAAWTLVGRPGDVLLLESLFDILIKLF